MNKKQGAAKRDYRLAKAIFTEEMDILTEMIRRTVMQNASATVTEDEYRRRYNDLTDRFHAEEEKHKRLTAERKRMDAESIAIGGMLFELTELDSPPIEFDEKLWHAVVDRVTFPRSFRVVTHIIPKECGKSKGFGEVICYYSSQYLLKRRALLLMTCILIQENYIVPR